VHIDRDRTVNESTSTMTIDRVARLRPEEFRDHYLAKGRPVIFGGALEAWPALRSWTPEYLTERWGDRYIEHRGIEGTLAEILERAAASRPERPEPYLKNLKIQDKLPELLPDITPRLEHASPNWFDSPLLPSMIRSNGTANELFIGGHGSTIPRLHHDEYGVHNFISQIYGTKEFWFYPPEAGQFLYPAVPPDNPYLSQVEDPRSPDLDRFPLFNAVEPIKQLLHPGETVFVAPGWWHWTWMPELSISVGSSCANSSNWSRYAREFSTAFGRAGRPKWAAFSFYLRAFGALKSVTSS